MRQENQDGGNIILTIIKRQLSPLIQKQNKYSNINNRHHTYRYTFTTNYPSNKWLSQFKAALETVTYLTEN